MKLPEQLTWSSMNSGSVQFWLNFTKKPQISTHARKIGTSSGSIYEHDALGDKQCNQKCPKLPQNYMKNNPRYHSRLKNCERFKETL